MQIKLIDVKYSDPALYETGTCEQCFNTAVLTDVVYVFEYPDGSQEGISSLRWEWEEYSMFPNVDNVVDFANYVAQQKFLMSPKDRLEWWQVDELIKDYNSKKRGK